MHAKALLLLGLCSHQSQSTEGWPSANMQLMDVFSIDTEDHVGSDDLCSLLRMCAASMHLTPQELYLADI